jgi:hypothetical protein
VNAEAFGRAWYYFDGWGQQIFEASVCGLAPGATYALTVNGEVVGARTLAEGEESVVFHYTTRDGGEVPGALLPVSSIQEVALYRVEAEDASLVVAGNLAPQ